MGKCKICGKTIEGEKDICEQCQQELENIELNMDDIDISIDDLELSELTGELLETDLEFELVDPKNDLENPDIEIHDWPSESEEMDYAESKVKDSQVGLAKSQEMEDTLPIENLDAILEEQPEEMEMGELPDTIPESVSEEMEISDLLLDVEAGEAEVDLEDLLSGIEKEATEMEVSDLLPEMDQDDLVASLDDLAAESISTIPDAGDENEEVMSVDHLLDGILDTAADDVSEIELLEGQDEGVGLFEDGLSYDNDEELQMQAELLEELPDVEAMVEQDNVKPKLSIWKRLFGNVKDEKWEKQKEKEERAAREEAERLAKIEEEKAKQQEVQEGEEGEPKIDPKEAKKAAKLAKKEEKAKKKEERKAEKQRLKELAEIEDVDEGRINRVGAAIVFVTLGMIAAGTIIGTNVFGYNNSVRRAEAYFIEDEYTAAYAQLNGLELKEEDKELYHKVQIVMYVNKQLNSYKNYTGIRMYPEALDSLIKGLKKYDKHIEEAKQMDVTEDFEKIRNRILYELQNEYNLSEQEAYDLIKIADHQEYSKKVIKIANE